MSCGLRNFFFLIKVVFLPNTEELFCSEVYVKFKEVMAVVFTCDIVLSPFKTGCWLLKVNEGAIVRELGNCVQFSGQLFRL